MSKISKSIVISEFLWLRFFAVVFLKFDYTRTTLAVVNAIVWLCIVLVFSIIILQFLTRQAFTKVRGILLVLIFLIIDQVIKADGEHGSYGLAVLCLYGSPLPSYNHA